MVRRVEHWRSPKHACVLNRLSTRFHASHRACQLVEHIVANVLKVKARVTNVTESIQTDPVRKCAKIREKNSQSIRKTWWHAVRMWYWLYVDEIQRICPVLGTGAFRHWY
ncbi:hypothetical protein Y032_0345g3113 [Ancylostoma ceylanicum]|uniref:Uncharacterized protein n=1 Tax=Ancylostoma ceylanicum TaxID=53326 RepID=A0A016RX87_9BILA|nr:hypothetical protein Y032_0345g3113 [Ancylostoma ceylanicum]